VIFESVEVSRPQLAVGGEPLVELSEWLRPDAVQAALRIGARLDEPRLLEDAEMLRDGGLAEADAVDELADGPFTVAEQIEDLKPARLSQDLQRRQSVHRDEYLRLVICLSRNQVP
jgi:hypothetical protein